MNTQKINPDVTGKTEKKKKIKTVLFIRNKLNTFWACIQDEKNSQIFAHTDSKFPMYFTKQIKKK